MVFMWVGLLNKMHKCQHDINIDAHDNTTWCSG